MILKLFICGENQLQHDKFKNRYLKHKYKTNTYFCRCIINSSKCHFSFFSNLLFAKRCLQKILIICTSIQNAKYVSFIELYFNFVIKDKKSCSKDLNYILDAIIFCSVQTISIKK